MSNMGTLAPITASTQNDRYVVRQNGIDYTQTRDVVAENLSNSRWNSTVDYLQYSRTKGSDGETYTGVQASGPNSGGSIDPVNDTDWSHWKPLWAFREVENKLKSNQNLNVIGKQGNPVPNTVAEVYPVGEEIASGVVAVTECTITKSVTGLITGTGVYGIKIEGDFSDNFFGVKTEQGNISSSGASLSFSGGFTELQVDLDNTVPHKFPQISEQKGVSPDIENQISSGIKIQELLLTRVPVDEVLNRSANTVYTNTLPYPIEVSITYFANASLARFTFEVDGVGTVAGTESAVAAVSVTQTKTINPQQTYAITGSRGSIEGDLRDFIEVK